MSYRNDAREFVIAEQGVLLLLWIMCWKMSARQAMPGWTVFQMSVSNKVVVVTTAIAYPQIH